MSNNNMARSPETPISRMKPVWKEPNQSGKEKSYADARFSLV
jgi:hypothetical protein